MRTVLSVSLPPKIAKELAAVAKETGRNKSDIVKESLGLYLWEAKLHKAQKAFSLKAKSIGIITEEDMFREIS
jgi:predicted DNA-binding protein